MVERLSADFAKRHYIDISVMDLDDFAEELADIIFKHPTEPTT